MVCPFGLSSGTGLGGSFGSSICYLRSDFGALSDGHSLFRLGTGAIMNTDATGTYVLTAAHNVFINANAQKASKVELWFGCIGSSAQDYSVTDQYKLPQAFLGASYDPTNDFAVIWVPALDQALFPPIGLFMSQNPQNARLVGYPVEAACAGTRQPFHADLSANPSSPDNYAYGQVTYEGMSGGPLIVSRPDGVLSCGVHIQGTGADRAVRVSNNMASQLSQWVK